MIINERRNKIFRILDDALANRPIERDSLILEVRKAFEAFDLLRNSEPLPSAQPERKTGKWIDDIDDPNSVTAQNYGAYCSVCETMSDYLTDYCGSCGADMRGTWNETD